MGRAKPYNPADLALSRHAAEEIAPVYDTAGFRTEARRRVNVFVQWRDSGSTEAQKREARSMSAHGVCLMALYARAHGVAGGRDVGVGDYVDEGFTPTLSSEWGDYFRALGRVQAKDAYAAIMAQVGLMSARVLTGLCHDWFFGDGRAVTQTNGRREAPWRSVVREIYLKAGRQLGTSNEETMAVWEALQNLKHAKW